MLKNIGSVWLTTLVTLGVVVVSKPLVAGTLGDHSDTWITANSWISFLVLIAAGIPMATTRQVARQLAKQDDALIQQTVSSSAGIYLGLGVLAVVIGALMFAGFEFTYVRAVLDGEMLNQRNDVRLGFLLLVLYAAISFITQLPYGIFNAHQDFVRTNAMQTGVIVGKLSLIVLLLPLFPTTAGMCGIVLSMVVLEWFVGRTWAGRRYPRIRLNLSAFDRKAAGEILNFSIFVLLLNLGIKLTFHLNTVVLGWYGEFKATTLYEAANSPLIYLFPLAIAVGQVMMPEVVKSKELGDLSKLRSGFLKWSRVTLAFGIYPLLFLAVLGPNFVARWMRVTWNEASASVQANTATAITVLSLGAILFIPARGLSMQVLMGLGSARAPALIFAGAGVVNGVLALILVQSLGMVGPAIATAVSMTLIGVWLTVMCCRELGTPLREWCVYVLFRPLLAAIPVLALLIFLKQSLAPQSYPTLIACGVAGGVLHLALWAGFVLRGDPYIRLKDEIATRWPKRFRRD